MIFEVDVDFEIIDFATCGLVLDGAHGFEGEGERARMREGLIGLKSEF